MFHSKLLNFNKNQPEIWLKVRKAESVKTLHHETMATLAGYRRGATTLCHNPVRGAERSAACRDLTRPCCRRAGGTPLLQSRCLTARAVTSSVNPRQRRGHMHRRRCVADAPPMTHSGTSVEPMARQRRAIFSNPIRMSAARTHGALARHHHPALRRCATTPRKAM